MAFPALVAAQADDVIARYQKLLAGPESARVALAGDLAAIPGARATSLLRQELENARDAALQLALLAGLAQHARPELCAQIGDVLRATAPDVELATAVGKALVAAGDAGVAPLIEAIERFATGRSNHRSRPAVFERLVAALARLRSPVSLAATAALARKGHAADRQRVLATLATVDGAHGVHAARTDALQADSAPLVLEGLRQLAEHDAANLPATLQAVAARATGPLEDALLAGVAVQAARKLQPELYAVFLRSAVASDPYLERGLRPHAAKLCADAGLAAFVLARARSLQSAHERALAARLVRAQPGSETMAWLVELAQAREPEVADPAIAALGERGDVAAVPALRKLLRAPGADRRNGALLALHTLLRAAPEWAVELRALLADAQLRVLAVDCLADLGDNAALSAVHELFADPEWRVRAAAYDFCQRVRAAASVPRLLDRLAHERDRLRQDVLDVLHSLTGQQLHNEKQWRDWWADRGAAFVPVDAKARATRRADPGAGATRTYYSLPVVSAAVIFVIDRSGSMAEKIGTGGSTRLEEAKRQIVRVLSDTPEGHRVGIVAFDGGVRTLQDKLTTVNDKTRASLITRVQALRIGSATNVHDAMEAALADIDVDTIYLLTDGNPSVGAITDPAALRARVAQWNRTRRVRIHAISVGTDSALLRGIAEDAGGRYVSVR